MSERKLGRPTNNPKDKRITIRISSETEDILNKYCKQENIEVSEGVRRGIKKLEEDIK